MAFTLQPATKDDFINREKILDEMLSTLADERTRMGFALVGPRKVARHGSKANMCRQICRREE